MYKIIGITCGVLVIAIAVLWIMIDKRSSDIGQLQRFAAAGNLQAPRMFNYITRLDSVSTDKMAVIFHFTVMLKESEIDNQSIQANELQWFRTEACTNPQIKETILEPGYAIVRSYQDIDQIHLFQMRLGQTQCQ